MEYRKCKYKGREALALKWLRRLEKQGVLPLYCLLPGAADTQLVGLEEMGVVYNGFPTSFLFPSHLFPHPMGWHTLGEGTGTGRRAPEQK